MTRPIPKHVPPHDRVRLRAAQRFLARARMPDVVSAQVEHVLRRITQDASASPVMSVRPAQGRSLAGLRGDMRWSATSHTVTARQVVVGATYGVALGDSPLPLFVWRPDERRWVRDERVFRQLLDVLYAMDPARVRAAGLASEWLEDHNRAQGQVPPSPTAYLRHLLGQRADARTEQAPEWLWPDLLHTDDWSAPADRRPALPRLYDARCGYADALDYVRDAGVTEPVLLRPVIARTGTRPRPYARGAWAVYRRRDERLIGIVAHTVGYGAMAHTRFQPYYDAARDRSPDAYNGRTFECGPARYESICCATTGEEIAAWDDALPVLRGHPLPRTAAGEIVPGVIMPPPAGSPPLAPTDRAGEFPVVTLVPELRPGERYDAELRVVWTAADLVAIEAEARAEDAAWEARRQDPRNLVAGSGVGLDGRWAIWVHLLAEHQREHGHCFPQVGETYRGVDLYRWVQNALRLYRKGELPDERRRTLDAIPGWDDRVANRIPATLAADRMARQLASAARTTSRANAGTKRQNRARG